jgi:hypothetical protein
MATPLMWKAMDFQFKLMKYIPPYPFSYNSKAKRLLFQKQITYRLLLWYVLTSFTMTVELLSCVAVLVDEILSPIKSLSNLQILTLSTLSIFSIYSLSFMCICLSKGQDAQSAFNELILIETTVQKG